MASDDAAPRADEGQHQLMPGTEAPDFALPSGPDASVALRDFRGQPVILLFYPFDWSPVCSDQVSQLTQVMPELERRNTALLGISVDSGWSHAAFADARGIPFPLLADFEPKGDVGRAYGVYRTGDGYHNRAFYVLDGKGTIRWHQVVDPWVNPGTDDLIAALDQLAGNAT